jgi:hypothetical protein
MQDQAGQHAHFNLTPLRFAGRLASLGTKRRHHPIGTQNQGGLGKLGLKRLWCWQSPASGGLQLGL